VGKVQPEIEFVHDFKGVQHIKLDLKAKVHEESLGKRREQVIVIVAGDIQYFPLVLRGGDEVGEHDNSLCS